MKEGTNHIYSTIVSLEALWRMNPEDSLINIIISAVASTENPPVSLSSCDNETLLEGLYNLIERRHKG